MFRGVLPAVYVLVGGILTVLGVLTYRLTHPGAVQESVNPSFFWLTFSDVRWNTRQGQTVAGWWIPGQEGRPGIVLVPGYGMSRSDVLSLASVLNQQGFGVLTYDQRGCGALPRGASTLGLAETDDLLAALDFLNTRPESTAGRTGIYGVDIGARAALRAAAARPDVQVVVADSVFDSVNGFIGAWVSESLGLHSRALEFGVIGMFGIWRLGYRTSMFERMAAEALAQRHVLFIQGDNRRELGERTAEVYGRIKAAKEIMRLPVSRIRNMSGEDVKSYDLQVSEYFRLNLP